MCDKTELDRGFCNRLIENQFEPPFSYLREPPLVDLPVLHAPDKAKRVSSDSQLDQSLIIILMEIIATKFSISSSWLLYSLLISFHLQLAAASWLAVSACFRTLRTSS